MKRKAGITFLVVVMSFVSGALILGSQSCSSDQFKSHSISGNDLAPSWSPDGSRIAFQSDRDGNYEIYVMNADGSSQTRLSHHPAGDYLPSWSSDGSRIAFNSDRDGNLEIYVMNSDGTDQKRVTDNPASDTWLEWSPAGPKIVFVSERDGNPEIYIMYADGTAKTRLTNNPADDWEPSVSPDGTRIAFQSFWDGNWEIYVMEADGTNQTRLTDNPAVDGRPSWSPDGTRIAFQSTRDGNWEIYVMEADGTNQTRLTETPTSEGRTSWSPDGQKIAFSTDRDFVAEIYVMDVDGSNPTNLTNSAPAIDTCSSIPLPQSELNLLEIPFRIVLESYRETDGQENWEICLIDTDGSDLINLTNTPDIDEMHPHASTDGSMVCFVVDEGGDQESRSRNVYYMNIEGTGRTKVAENAYQPCWSPDGKRIAYLPGEFSRHDPNSSANKGLEIYDLETKQVTRHPNENLLHLLDLSWAPDGEWFIARKREMGRNHAFRVDDITEMVLTIQGCAPDVSPDGERIVWNGSDSNDNIGILDFESPERNVRDHRVVIACERDFLVDSPDWSPDGNYIAFSYGPLIRGSEVDRISAGRDICILDLRTGKWTRITTDGKYYESPDWVPVLSSTP